MDVPYPPEAYPPLNLSDHGRVREIKLRALAALDGWHDAKAEPVEGSSQATTTGVELQKEAARSLGASLWEPRWRIDLRRLLFMLWSRWLAHMFTKNPPHFTSRTTNYLTRSKFSAVGSSRVFVGRVVLRPDVPMPPEHVATDGVSGGSPEDGQKHWVPSTTLVIGQVGS